MNKILRTTTLLAVAATGSSLLAGCGSLDDTADTASSAAASATSQADAAASSATSAAAAKAEKATSAAKAAATGTWTPPEGLSGDLQFYSANPQSISKELAAAFEEKTGVKTTIFSGSTGKVTARLKAEEANPQADVVYVASWAAASNLAKGGNLEAYTVTNQDDVHASWRSADGLFTGRDGSALALVVNTSVIPQMPADWEDLTKPEYKDQVIMPDPRESGTAADLISAMITAWGEEKTWDLFDRLFANGMVVQGANGPALDAVVSGSRGVVFGGVDYKAYAAKKKGEPVEVMMPASGTTVSPRPVMILKSSKNPEAAKAFADFMFSPEGQQIAVKHFMIPGITGVDAVEGQPYDQIKQLTDNWDDIAAKSKDTKATFAEKYLG